MSLSKKYARPVLIIGATGFLICIIALAAASCYLNSAAFGRMLVERLNAAMAGTLAVGHHQVSLLRGRATLSDVVLSGADGKQLAVLDRLHSGLFWPALVKREIRLTRLDLEIQALELAYDSQDRLPLMRALSFPGASAPAQTRAGAWAVTIDAFRMVLGDLRIQRSARQWHGSLAQVEVTGGGRITAPAGQVSASVGRLVWRGGQGRETSIRNLAVSAGYAPSAASPMRLDLQTSNTALTIFGDVDWQAPVPSLDLAYSIDLDLALAQSLLVPDQTVAGRARAKGRLHGALDDPGATLHLEVAGGRLGELSFQLGLDAGLSQRQLTLSGMKVVGSWGEADLSGTIDLRPMFARNWREATAGLETPVYDLKLNARRLRPDQWPGVTIGFTHGGLEVSAHARGNGFFGDGITGRGDMTIQAKAVRVTDTSEALDGQLSADISWADQILQIVDCDVAAGPNKLNARGRIDLASRRMDVRGDVDLGNMRKLGAQLVLPMPEGRIAVSVRGHGDPAAPTIQTSLLARDLAWADWTIGKLLVESALSPEGTLEISRIALENQGSLVRGRGVVTLLDADRHLVPDPAVELTLGLEQIDIDDFYPFDPIKGQLNGKLILGGSLKHPIADLDLGQSPVRWRELAVQARGKARWQDGRLAIPELRLSGPSSAVQLRGSASWRHPKSGQWVRDPLVTARLQSKTLRLEDLHQGWTGAVRFDAKVDGAISDLRGEYQVRADSLNIAGQPLHAFESNGRLRDHRLHIDRLAVSVVDGQDIQARGWYDFDERYKLNLDSAGVDLEHIPALQQAYPVAGRMKLNLTGSGSLGQPDFSGLLHVARPQFRDRALPDFHIDLRVRDNRVRLDADLNFTLTGSARLDSGAFDLDAVFDKTDLSPYLALGAGPNWSGRLSGVLKAAGNWHAPMKTRLNSGLTDLQLIYRSIPLISADSLNIELREGVIQIPASRIRIMRDGHLSLEASGTLRKDLDLRADGRLPLAALAPFSDLVAAARGNLEIHLRARGLWPDIPWQVDLTLADIGMTLPELTQSISDVNGRVVLTSQALNVEDLAGRVDSGRFSLNGRVRLKEMRPVQGRLDLSARSLPLQWPGTMDLVLHGDLSLSGRSRGAQLSGRLDLVEGTYYKDVRLNLLSAVTRPGRRRPAPATDQPPPWMEAIDMDVTVGYRNPLLVDNNLANLTIAPNLRLKGTLARPVLNGRAEVTDGELIYRRKTFAVERGLVDFINPYDNEPTLDILSQAKIRNWQVSLAVTGTPDELRLKLSSDPPEADNDILSLILLGRTNKELMRGRGRGGQTTTQMLATLLATAWGEDVKKTTGMDILELETGAEDENDSQDRTQVTLGKKLSRRLTVKYALESNRGDMIQQAISEYRFLEHLLVSGFQDSRGDYGGELLFRIEFQ